jgi:hypothetical protein
VLAGTALASSAATSRPAQTLSGTSGGISTCC